MPIRTCFSAIALLLAFCGPSNALTFNFTFTAGTSAQVQQAFVRAGARWSAVLTDDVSVDMTVGAGALSPGLLLSAGQRRASFTYGSFRAAIGADQTSDVDTTAVPNLSSGSSFGLLINRTSDNPNGAGSATPYVDVAGANNTTINMTTANAKALGLVPPAGTVGVCVGTCDASLVFNSAFAFDYEPGDGITAGTYDFVGIATHELGHALGFVSGVDILDINSPPVNGPFAANQFTFVSPLDLYRFSTLSIASSVIDFTADTRSKFFSLDRGTTVGPEFATGRNFGDGQLPSHWKDSLGLGLMDPTAAQGELLVLRPNDLTAFDAIGWNVTVPEPSGVASLAFGVVALVAFGRTRRTV